MKIDENRRRSNTGFVLSRKIKKINKSKTILLLNNNHRAYIYDVIEFRIRPYFFSKDYNDVIPRRWL